MNELKATRQYRLELANSLEFAQQRLARRDFEMMASGIREEIQHLDQQIAELEFSAFMGLKCEPLVPTVLRLVQRACLRVEGQQLPVASGLANQMSRLGGVKRYMQTSNTNGRSLPSDSPTFAMSGGASVCA